MPLVVALPLVLVACGHDTRVSHPNKASRLTSSYPSAHKAIPTQKQVIALLPKTGDKQDHPYKLLAGQGESCGKERWDVKTLTDPNVQSVNFTPQVTTIAGLTQIAGNQPAPNGPDAPRQGPIESQAYELQDITVVEAKTEADSDYHVVVQDPNSQKTMVVEFPAPWCDTGSPYKAQIDAARTAFEAAFGVPTPSMKQIGQTATIVGVGYLDFDHGQTGRDQVSTGADVELHPVVSLKVSSSTNSVVVPTTTSGG